MDEFKIDKNVPIPPKPTKWGDRVAKMVPGDSCVITKGQLSSITRHIKDKGYGYIAKPHPEEAGKCRVWMTEVESEAEAEA